jgi:GT2 family glycosyltransferase
MFGQMPLDVPSETRRHEDSVVVNQQRRAAGPAPVVSVIITNWNGRGVLHECLRSVYERTSGIAFEVIVVDDASSDDSVTMVTTRFPQARLVVNDRNLGFVRSNNRGLLAASGRYVLLLNSDTVLLNNALRILAEFLDHHPEVGACGGWLRNPDLSSQMSYGDFPSLHQAIVDGLFLNDLFPGLRLPNRTVIPRRTAVAACEVNYICGADLFVRKDLVDRIGLFDERFQAYCEETDLCYRISHDEGLKVCFVPDAQIVHLGGVSYEKLGRRRLQLQYNSYDKFFRKHHGHAYAVVTRALYAWHYAVKALVRSVYFLMSRQSEKERYRTQVLRAVFAVWYSVFPRLPEETRGPLPEAARKV